MKSSSAIFMSELPLCEFCKKVHTSKKFHCNHCEKKHSICDKCIITGRAKMNLRPVKKGDVFDSNLVKWA